MAEHIDIVQNSSHAGEVLLARVRLVEGVVGIEPTGETSRDIEALLTDGVFDLQTREMRYPSDGATFYTLLPAGFGSRYLVADGPHTDEDCRFVRNNRIQPTLDPDQ